MDANVSSKYSLLVILKHAFGVKKLAIANVRKDGVLKDISKIRRHAFANVNLKNAQKELFGILKNVSVTNRDAMNHNFVLLSKVGILFNANAFVQKFVQSANVDNFMTKKPAVVNQYNSAQDHYHNLILFHILSHTQNLFQNLSSSHILFHTSSHANTIVLLITVMVLVPAVVEIVVEQATVIHQVDHATVTHRMDNATPHHQIADHVQIST